MTSFQWINWWHLPPQQWQFEIQSEPCRTVCFNSLHSMGYFKMVLSHPTLPKCPGVYEGPGLLNSCSQASFLLDNPSASNGLLGTWFSGAGHWWSLLFLPSWLHSSPCVPSPLFCPSCGIWSTKRKVVYKCVQIFCLPPEPLAFEKLKSQDLDSFIFLLQFDNFP